MSRYRDKVDQWLVAGETIFRGEFVGEERNIWLRNGGVDLIAQMFHWAREADPDAKLMYQFDRNEEFGTPQSEAVYRHIRNLVEQGTPIDMLGMEMHLFGTDPPDKRKVIENMNRYQELGIEVAITELDVNMAGVQGTQEEKQALQAQIYRDMLEACLESETCHSVAFWGYKLPHTWMFRSGYPYGPAETYLLFDGEGNPNQTYFALRDALRAAISEP